MPDSTVDSIPDQNAILCGLPDDVSESIEARDEWLRTLSSEPSGLEFLVSDVRAWMPGQTVRVAFLGGTSSLHREIVAATKEISEACNLVLDFGFDAAQSTYRGWSQADEDYAAEIRVGFDQKGYFSLVGTDSVNAGIGKPGAAVGGRPSQRSLNLGGFLNAKPHGWQGTVKHEFLHALAFQHSHQNMRGPCEAAFRWEDDPGYAPTRNADGSFLTDREGRRPGIYTYLSGWPNGWDRAKVDHNMRTQENPASVAGPFDRLSVMLYRFPEMFYQNPTTECAPIGDGSSLSDGDRRGLRLLYPHVGAGEQPIKRIEDKQALLRAIDERQQEGLEGLESSFTAFARATSTLLRRGLAIPRICP